MAQADGFSHFHLYVCAAFLVRWKSDLLKKTDFHTLLMFLQNLPTNKWDDSDIGLLVAEAYKLSYLFAGAPSHLTAGAAVQSSGSAAANASSWYNILLIILVRSGFSPLRFDFSYK